MTAHYVCQFLDSHQRPCLCHRAHRVLSLSWDRCSETPPALHHAWKPVSRQTGSHSRNKNHLNRIRFSLISHRSVVRLCVSLYFTTLAFSPSILVFSIPMCQSPINCRDQAVLLRSELKLPLIEVVTKRLRLLLGAWGDATLQSPIRVAG